MSAPKPAPPRTLLRRLLAFSLSLHLIGAGQKRIGGAVDHDIGQLKGQFGTALRPAGRFSCREAAIYLRTPWRHDDVVNQKICFQTRGEAIPGFLFARIDGVNHANQNARSRRHVDLLRILRRGRRSDGGSPVLKVQPRRPCRSNLLARMQIPSNMAAAQTDAFRISFSSFVALMAIVQRSAEKKRSQDQ